MSYPSIYLVEFIIEALIPVLFFRKVPVQNTTGKIAVQLGYASTLLLIPLFFRLEYRYTVGASVVWTCFRFFYRVGVYTIYVKLVKRSSWQICVYLGLLLTSLYTIFQIYIQIPIVAGRSYFFNTILYLPSLLLCAYVLPLNHIAHITKERIATVSVVIACLLYTKTALFSYQPNEQPLTASVQSYFILLHVFLLLFLLLFERHAYGLQELEIKKVQEVSNRYIIASLMAKRTAEEEIRALHHDMKNHLLVVEKMASKGGTDEIRTYVEKLLEKPAIQDRTLFTGNRMLDGLLEEKLGKARENHIQVQVSVDFRQANYVDAVDLCTIFSNIMDNAIGACKEVEEDKQRYIQVTSMEMAQYLFVSVENGYNGERKFKGGMPVTTKRNPHLHGFGLKNAREAVEKYGGELQVKADESGIFTTVVSFPIATKQE